MCCCKWCQYYLESIYWHCIEKHFCFDINIALYNEEDDQGNTRKPGVDDFYHPTNDDTKDTSTHKSPSVFRAASNNNIYENMAFYDNVAVIANRSIFIIDPQDVRKPKEPSPLPQRINFDAPRARSEDALDTVITEQPKFTPAHHTHAVNLSDSISYLENTRSEPNLNDITATTDGDTSAASSTPMRMPKAFKSIPRIHTNAASTSSLEPISEAHEHNPHMLQLPAAAAHVQMRKKSLHERRVSKSLTLDIDARRQEVPIIRQSSFPKFYIDTPESNQKESSIGPNSIQALETPVQPSMFQFDLKTVVQLQNERHEEAVAQAQSAQGTTTAAGHALRRSQTSVKDNRKIAQLRDKLKPIMLLRNASTQSLYSSPRDS